MLLSKRIRYQKLQNNINREAAKTSAFWSAKKRDMCEHLIVEEMFSSQ